MSEKPHYERLGAMFRGAREAVPVRLEKVSRDLFIRVHYLKSLESGNFHELPGPAYVKGYLLAYAQYLHMDEQEILRQFHTIEADFRRSLYFPSVLGKEKRARPWMVAVGLTIVIITCTIWLSHTMPVLPSVVDDIDAWRQQLLTKGHISAFSARDQACFQSRDSLYPPCYAEEPRFDLLPLKRRSVSVMDVIQVAG